MMTWKRWAGAALAGVTTLLVGSPSPAGAEAPIATVKVVGCQEVVQSIRDISGRNTNRTRWMFGGDGWTESSGDGFGSGHVIFEAGDYTWRLQVEDSTGRMVPKEHGRFTVKRCDSPFYPRENRLRDGDESGDGLADIMAVGQDGTLRYYRRTATGLAAGTVVGRGWQGITWAQRSADTRGMWAKRSDGTLWGYTHRGQGRYAGASNLGDGFGSSSDLGLYQGSTADDLSHVTLGLRQNGRRYRLGWNSEIMHGPFGDRGAANPKVAHTIPVRDFDGDGWGDELRIGTDGVMTAVTTTWDKRTTTRVVGHGWSGARVFSPGDLTGDKLADLVTIRSDGTMWLYPNVTVGGGHGWGKPVRLGTGWGGMKLVF